MAMDMEGTAACLLNASNEIVVDAYLKEKIGFLDIARINEKTLLTCQNIKNPTYEDFVESDREARAFALSLI
jgi:1-deoxy-D-xylulose-5-phosphate reductoisomerase